MAEECFELLVPDPFSRPNTIEDGKFVCHTVHRRSDGAGFRKVAINCQQQVENERLTSGAQPGVASHSAQRKRLVVRDYQPPEDFSEEVVKTTSSLQPS